MSAPADTRAEQALRQGFQLGELHIDPSTGEMSGPGGSERLDPKVMNLLLELARRAGQLVPREDLLAQLWPDAAVTDEVLSRCVYELRRHLSRAGSSNRYKAMLETLPKRGYRLNGEVTFSGRSSGAGAPERPKRPFLPIGIAALAALLLLVFVGQQALRPASESPPSVKNSIAVLPFVDMSEGQDYGYLGDGIAEEILSRLAQSKDLRVISRTSSFAFRGRQLGVREIAAKLDVDHVLEGSVRRSGDNIRITAQLIAASDNAHVWSGTFDREFGDTFRVQNEIAASVATALQVTLRGSDACCPAPASPEALELFLRGQFFYNRRAPGDIERSVKYYRDALAIDPAFARSWAALAGAYNLLSFEDGADQERLLPLQGEAAHKAVELAPRMAVAHARLGQYYFRTADPVRGDEHFQRAQALDPNDELVMGFSSEELVWRGDYAAAVETWRRLVERDPLSPTNRLNYGAFLTMAGRYPEAISEHRKAFELNPDLNWNAHFTLARALILQRQYEAAHAEILKIPEGEPRDFGLALLHAAPGHAAEAHAALQRMVARPLAADDVSLAEAYAHRGMTDEAFAALHAARNAIYERPDRQVRDRPRLLQLKFEMLKSPFLMPLQSDRRWQEFMTAN